MNGYEVFKSGPRKGQPKTLTDRVVRYLVKSLGMVERGKHGKYRWFTKGRNYFVGSNGAVRTGVTISDSVSITASIHARMKAWEQRLQECVDKCNAIVEAEQATKH